MVDNYYILVLSGRGGGANLKSPVHYILIRGCSQYCNNLVTPPLTRISTTESKLNGSKFMIDNVQFSLSSRLDFHFIFIHQFSWHQLAINSYSTSFKSTLFITSFPLQPSPDLPFPFRSRRSLNLFCTRKKLKNRNNISRTYLFKIIMFSFVYVLNAKSNWNYALGHIQTFLSRK